MLPKELDELLVILFKPSCPCLKKPVKLMRAALPCAFPSFSEAKAPSFFKTLLNQGWRQNNLSYHKPFERKRPYQTVCCFVSQRLNIETPLQELTDHLNCKINTLGHPPAAIFTSWMALISYMVLSVIKVVLSSVYGANKMDKELSSYYLESTAVLDLSLNQMSKQESHNPGKSCPRLKQGMMTLTINSSEWG